MNRLTRTRFAGDNIQSRPELQRHFVDHGKILDPQLAQHIPVELTLPPLELFAQNFVVTA